MNTRTLCHQAPSRSGATRQEKARADAPPASAPALPKAAAERLARLDAADMPWLGQGQAAMLAGYDGPEVTGSIERPAHSTKRR